MNTKKAALTVVSIALKIVIFAALVVVLLRIGSVAYEYGHAVFEEEALDEAPGRTIPVTVPEGASAMDIARQMEDEDGEDQRRGTKRGAKIGIFGEQPKDGAESESDGHAGRNDRQSSRRGCDGRAPVAEIREIRGTQPLVWLLLKMPAVY